MSCRPIHNIDTPAMYVEQTHRSAGSQQIAAFNTNLICIKTCCCWDRNPQPQQVIIGTDPENMPAMANHLLYLMTVARHIISLDITKQQP